MSEDNNYRNRNFVIAEILACISFILNTLVVFTAKEINGPGAPSWIPHFGLVYWSKTILAAIGLFYFFTSGGVFRVEGVPLYVSISTVIVLWYSIPIVNFLLYGIPAMIFMYILNQDWMTYEIRIPTQITWSLPMFIVAIDLLIRLIKIKKKL